MGFELVKDHIQKTISINHSQYIDAVLRQFNMHECNSINMPMDHSIVLSKDNGPQTKDEIAKMKSQPYHELVGALIWLSVVSCPDIAFAATHLARFNANPGKAHWKAAKCVLCYLKGTHLLCLTLRLHSDGNEAKCTGYSDSDWGCDINNWWSIAGFVFLLSDSVILWNSKKQPTVAMLATEGKYMATSHSARQGIWLRHLLIEFGLELENKAITLFLNNCGTMDLSKEAHFHTRTKHIDIHHHFIRECVENKTIEVIHCPSSSMLADGLTKPLAHTLFSNMADNLGLTPYWGGVLNTNQYYILYICLLYVTLVYYSWHLLMPVL